MEINISRYRMEVCYLLLITLPATSNKVTDTVKQTISVLTIFPIRKSVHMKTQSNANKIFLVNSKITTFSVTALL